MALDSSTLRPGLLVSLKTHIRGNVQYSKTMLEDEHETDSGAQKARWETERTVYDPAELERAKKARNKASTAIRRVCTLSQFGLLCPTNAEDDLEAAIKTARKICADFNADAKNTRVDVYAITGRVAADDVEAVRAINSEVRDLLDDMNRGLKNADVKVIRQAANDARQLAKMLSPEAEGRVRAAIEAARSAAKDIVKASETAEIELDRSAIKRIREARASFLDVEEETVEVKRPKARGRALDLTAEK